MPVLDWLLRQGINREDLSRPGIYCGFDELLCNDSCIDKQGQTPFWIASARGQTGALEWLLTHGVNAEIASRTGNN